MIHNYYKVNDSGDVLERYRLEEDDPFIELKSLVKEWDGEMSSPSYAHLLKKWVDKEDVLKVKKEQVKQYLSSQCKQAILNGFSHTVGGVTYHFSYDQESQLNFQDTIRLFDNSMLETISWTAEARGEKVRLKLNKKDFTLIYNESVKQKLDKISHLRDTLIPLIEAASSEEELESIHWGVPSGTTNLNTSQTLEKRVSKVDFLEYENRVQKQHNHFTETLIMEVLDMSLT